MPRGGGAEVLGVGLLVALLVYLARAEQLDHVLEVSEPVVDGRGGEHEDLLYALGSFEQIVEPPVVCERLGWPTPETGIAEMVGLINQDNVGHFLHAIQAVLVVAPAEEIGMVEDDQVAEVAPEVPKIAPDVPFPDIVAPGFRDQQDHTLPVVHDKPLDQHQADERLAKPDAVAQEGTAVLRRDLQQGVVPLLLVAVQDGVHLRLRLFPFGNGHFVTAEELLERPRIDLERRVLADVPLKDPQDFWSDVLGVAPVSFVPLLEGGDWAAGNLNVEFDVLGQAGEREVGGADQGGRADNLHARVGDVGFGVELGLAVDPALDVPRADGVGDGGNTC